VDFLSGNERYSVVELMRVTVCMSQLLRAVSLRHFVLNLQLGIFITHMLRFFFLSRGGDTKYHKNIRVVVSS